MAAHCGDKSVPLLVMTWPTRPDEPSRDTCELIVATSVPASPSVVLPVLFSDVTEAVPPDTFVAVVEFVAVAALPVILMSAVLVAGL